MVFSTKNRHPYLTAEVCKDLYPYLGGILRELGCPLLKAGGMEDHVHLLFPLSRSVSLSQVVEKIKTGSSKWMKTQGGPFSGFSWQAGYGAFGVGPSEKHRVIQYIEGQEQHHRGVSFQDELRQLIREAGMECDERYLWD